MRKTHFSHSSFSALCLLPIICCCSPIICICCSSSFFQGKGKRNMGSISFGKLGTLVTNSRPCVPIKRITYHTFEKHDITRSEIEKWYKLPCIVLKQNEDRFLHITRQGAYVLHKNGTVITAWSRKEYHPSLLKIYQQYKYFASHIS